MPHSPTASGQTGEKGFGEHLGTCGVGLVEEQPLHLDGFPEQMGSEEFLCAFLKKKRRDFMFLLRKLFQAKAAWGKV